MTANSSEKIPGKEPPRKRLRRFYKQAEAAAATDGVESGAHAVLLDGRPVRAPGGTPLAVDSRALAEAIAAEWTAQGDEVVPESMPLTQLAFTALERVARDRPAVEAHLRGYAETDLLCYRVAFPDSLVARQAAVWQPLLDWAAKVFDAPLKVTTGVVAVEQPSDSIARLVDAVAELDVHHLTALATVTQAAGSLLIGLAVVYGELDGGEAADAAELDEAWQSEQWGQDREALQRRQALRDEIAAARRYLDLCEKG